MKTFTVAFACVLGTKSYTISAYDAEEAIKEGFVKLGTGTQNVGTTNVLSSVTSVTVTKL